MAKQWPPDIIEEFKRRTKLAIKLKVRPELRAAVMEHYRNNPIDWINDFVITYDPRRSDTKFVPFVLFPRQEQVIKLIMECIEQGESALIEKSRDVGLTWCCCAISVWMWIFVDGASIGWGSRDQDSVDKRGDPDSIFEKMRMIINRLPKWMMPDGYNEKSHSNFMKLSNPSNRSSIKGDGGDNIGRGGRSLVYFKDESAHYERPELIEASLGNNTNTQIDFSSVNGTANVFYRRRMAGEVWEEGKKIEPGVTRVFIFDWRDNPLHDQEWYDVRRKKAEAEGLLHVFAQEVDRDYSSSQDRIIIPQEWVKAAIDAHIKLGFDPSGVKFAMQDVADGGADKNALVARHGVVCNFAEHWAGEAGEAAKVAIPKCAELGVSELYYDSIGVGAGFKAQVNVMKDWETWPRKLKVSHWNAGAAPLDPDDPIIPNDPESPLNKEQYANMKAQAWFRVRSRFYKTYRAVIHKEQFPHDELISIDSTIPCLHELCLELSQAIKKDNGEGKTMVEKKPSGSKSPNLADAFVAVYNPCRSVSILDVI